MKNYRPLFFQELNLRLPGLRLRRLRLNRHIPHADQLSVHAHGFTQILCYLGGNGTLTGGREPRLITPGTAIFLPPRCPHGFRESTARRPLCLVLDLDWRAASRRELVARRLSQADLGAIRRELSQLVRLPDPTVPACRFLVAAGALRILDIILRGLEILPALARETPTAVRAFDRAIRRAETPLPRLAELAGRTGYQADHLNRLVKTATGLTLREYRDAWILTRARRLLREDPVIARTAETLGFSDQNYFARWFRKHTGLTPGAYARGSPAAPSASPRRKARGERPVISLKRREK